MVPARRDRAGARPRHARPLRRDARQRPPREGRTHLGAPARRARGPPLPPGRVGHRERRRVARDREDRRPRQERPQLGRAGQPRRLHRAVEPPRRAPSRLRGQRPDHARRTRRGELPRRRARRDARPREPRLRARRLGALGRCRVSRVERPRRSSARPPRPRGGRPLARTRRGARPLPLPLRRTAAPAPTARAGGLRRRLDLPRGCPPRRLPSRRKRPARDGAASVPRAPERRRNDLRRPAEPPCGRRSRGPLCRARLHGRRNARRRAHARPLPLRAVGPRAHGRAHPSHAARRGGAREGRLHGRRNPPQPRRARRGRAPGDGAFGRRGLRKPRETRLGRNPQPVRRALRGEPEPARPGRPPGPLDALPRVAAVRGVFARVQRRLHRIVPGRSRRTDGRMDVRRPLRPWARREVSLPPRPRTGRYGRGEPPRRAPCGDGCRRRGARHARLPPRPRMAELPRHHEGPGGRRKRLCDGHAHTGPGWGRPGLRLCPIREGGAVRNDPRRGRVPPGRGVVVLRVPRRGGRARTGGLRRSLLARLVLLYRGRRNRRLPRGPLCERPRFGQGVCPV